VNGLLIVFEGIDCCGKENQVARTRWWLADTTETKEVSQQVVIGREPTDEWSPIGRYIRSILQKRTPFPGNLELQRLFIVDRAQDLVCRIKPQLAQGIIRLQDRYALSTIAYGMLDGEAEQYIRLHQEIIGVNMCWPDLTIVLDISAEEAVRRQAGRDGKPEAELFEKRELLEKIRVNYLTLAQRDDIGPIVVVNGERPRGKVFLEIRRTIAERFFPLLTLTPSITSLYEDAL